ncbi:fimbria/pilus outer membrane usher protein [Ralstonia pseudosolanacearum]|uniref:Fimbrial biogenesis outer membrane usher protein n=1 Tax=Ralstonia pseudosolanacearum TaxID=1310165 RepID=A0A454TLP1_9RALS|nr:fimbria/pilus outer membrane usher protein [Ralstonia pseudosolanacearum]RNM03019.1 fimbrial biogenesis outer membrane usher protein [Ralstonia pseudosolanacearum]
MKLRTQILRGAMAVAPVALACVAAYASELSAPVQGQSIFPAIFVNQRPVDGVVRLLRRQGELFIRSADLPHLGIKNWIAADGELPLRAVPGLTYTYLESAQTLEISVPDDQLIAQQIGRQRERGAVDRASVGGVINYDLVTQYQSSGAGKQLTGYLSSEQRLILPFGVGANTGAYNSMTRRFMRYDTRFDFPFADDLGLLSVGDVISGSLSWSRAVRMGGIRIARNYAARPDLITFPTPLITGSAVVPTTVDLMVNNMRVLNTNVPSGPFVINDAPLLNGAGDVVLVVKDQLGRLVPTSLPLYVDSRLLRPGFYTYDFSLGTLRNGFGTSSLGYDSHVVSSGSLTYGLTDAMTAQAHLEAGAGLASGGMGGLVKLGNSGVMNANLSTSSLEGRRGASYGLGYQYISRTFSVTANTRYSTSGFSDLGSLSTFYVTRRQNSVTLSRSLGNASSVGLALVSNTDNAGVTTRAASTTFSTRIARGANLSLTLTKTTGGANQLQIFGALSLFFDNMPVIDVSSSHDAQTGANSLSVSNPPLNNSGWGFAGQLSHGENYRRGLGRVEYQGSLADGYAAIENVNTTTTSTVGLRGALTITSAGILPARYVYDAFGVVSTNGVPDVQILNNNLPIGRTNNQGYLLVPNLASYGINRISVDQDSLPDFASAPEGGVEMIPAGRSYVQKTIPIATARGIRIVAVDASGKALRPGALVRVGDDASISTVVGYDGQIYLEPKSSRTTVLVDDGASRCSMAVDVPPAAAGVQTIHATCK